MMFSACSEAPQKTAEKAPEPPPEPVSGSTAFFRMYTAARGWAGDVQPLRMSSVDLPAVKKVPGKAAAWQATFVSPQRQGAQRAVRAAEAIAQLKIDHVLILRHPCSSSV